MEFSGRFWSCSLYLVVVLSCLTDGGLMEVWWRFDGGSMEVPSNFQKSTNLGAGCMVSLNTAVLLKALLYSFVCFISLFFLIFHYYMLLFIIIILSSVILHITIIIIVISSIIFVIIMWLSFVIIGDGLLYLCHTPSHWKQLLLLFFLWSLEIFILYDHIVP